MPILSTRPILFSFIRRIFACEVSFSYFLNGTPARRAERIASETTEQISGK